MEILIYKDEQQLGPYSRDDIETHLKSGTLSLDDHAWMQGQSDWKPLAEILGRPKPSPSTTSATLDRTEETTPENAKASNLQESAESLVSKAIATAVLTQKQAQRKMIELVDLRDAHLLLGKKAYESGHVPLRYDYLVSQIEALVAGEGAGDATGAALRTAKNEGQTRKLNQLFSELGRRLHTDGVEHGPLKREVEATNKAFANVAALDREIAELSSQAYSWARRPLLVAGFIAGAVVLCFAIGKMSATYSRWSAEKERHRIEAQAAKEQARIAAETAEAQRKQAEELKVAQEAEEQLRSAQARMDAERREIERQEESRMRQAQAAAAARERGIQQAEERRQRTEKEAEALRKAELAKEQEKQARATFAADRFSQLAISPNVVLSATVRRAGAGVELHGQDLPQIQHLLQQRDYLTLLGHLRGTRYSAYPTTSEIESGLRTLLGKRFRILLKTNFRKNRNEELYLISFPTTDNTIARASIAWDREGNGQGYSHKWSLSDGPVIVLTGNSTTARAPVESYDQSARKQCEALRKQKEQNAIDEATYRASIAAIRQASYDALVKWAINR